MSLALMRRRVPPNDELDLEPEKTAAPLVEVAVGRPLAL
jgi:hypothetical protein